MRACFLANLAGIETKVEENQATYIKNWLKKLKNDKRFVVTAAAAAQEATDYILNENFQN